MLSTAVARSTSSPSCVSFSEMLRSMPDWTMASMMRPYSCARGLGLLEARHALAQVVEREAQAAVGQLRHRADGFFDGFAGDESPGESTRAHPVAGHQTAQCVELGERVKKSLGGSVDHAESARCSVRRAGM